MTIPKGKLMSSKEMAISETKLWNTKELGLTEKGTIVILTNKVFKQNLLSCSVGFEKEKH